MTVLIRKLPSALLEGVWFFMISLRRYYPVQVLRVEDVLILLSAWVNRLPGC